jgi:glycosyltransferase involved in cell wall biosynthesis
MSDEPRASVVVATRDRAASLARLLDALERQTVPRDAFEIVIVDDGSRDQTPALLERHRARADGAFTALRHPDSQGPAAARNLGWRSARGRVVAFTDDDCLPAPAWLAEGLAAVDSGAAIVMGRTIAEPGAPGLGEPFSRAMVVDHEDGRYPTCNVFYLRSALEEVGGFDESFRYACGEDTDLAWRAKAAGYPSTFAAAAVVEHAVRPPDFFLFLRERRRFAEQILVVRRHPELRRLFYRRWFYRRSHVHSLASVVLALGAAATTPWLLAALPLVWTHRLKGAELGRGPATRARHVAQILVADLWELAVFAAVSVRYRTPLI